MIEVIKANLCKEFVEADRLSGTIHSKFKSVINVVFNLGETADEGMTGTRLITIITNDLSDIPDSLVVSRQDFESLSRIPLDGGVKKTGDDIIFSDSLLCHIKRNSIVTGQLDFEGHFSYPDRQRELYELFNKGLYLGDRRDGFGMTYEEQYKRLSLFAHGMMNCELSASVEALTKNIGRGKGLTPSSDDAMVGIMAYTMGVMLANSHEAKEKYLSFAKLMIKQVSLKEYTTDVSCKYLYCASEGRFGQNLQDLMKWIFQDKSENIHNIIDRIIQTGSTSGTDLLVGVRIANEVCLKNGNYFL